MKVGTTRPALSDNVVSHDLPRTHQRISTLSPRVCLTLTLVAATILALFAGPMFLWVYHIERASRLMEAGLQWPEPRQVDSLPLLRNEHALMDAREHLVAAIRWRPEHSHAYRLLGQSFVAQGDWENAAEAFMQARERAPRHPLIAWEASLVYEHLGRIVAHAPRMALAAELAAGQLDAPARPVETPFCRDGVPQTCYAGETMFTLPYAELAAVPAAELPVLLLHPPARISHEMTIPPDRPALYFALGLDPAAHTWGSDGATFRVWVEPANGGRTTTDASPELAYEYMLGPDMAVQGWVPDWADLSRWAGQTVRLTLETDGGPAGDTTADWYGWGDIALTTVEAARAATLAPQARMRQAWNDAGGDARQFVARGEEAQQDEQFIDALNWYNRALTSDSKVADAWYFTGRVFHLQQKWSDALHAYAMAIKSGAFRKADISDVYFQQGMIYQQAPEYRDLDKALHMYDMALNNNAFGSDSLQAEAFYKRGELYSWQRRDPSVVMEEYRQALAIQPTHRWARLRLGYALYWYKKDVCLAEKEIQQAIAVWPDDPSQKWPYLYLGNIYRDAGLVKEALKAYEQALHHDPFDQKVREVISMLRRQ